MAHPLAQTQPCGGFGCGRSGHVSAGRKATVGLLGARSPSRRPLTLPLLKSFRGSDSCLAPTGASLRKPEASIQGLEGRGAHEVGGTQFHGAPKTRVFAKPSQ